MMMPWSRAVTGGVELNVQVVPRASTTETAVGQKDRLKIRLASTPVDGKADKALLHAVSKWTGIKRGKIVINSRTTGWRKCHHLDGATLTAVGAAFSERWDGLT